VLEAVWLLDLVVCVMLPVPVLDDVWCDFDDEIGVQLGYPWNPSLHDWQSSSLLYPVGHSAHDGPSHLLLHAHVQLVLVVPFTPVAWPVQSRFTVHKAKQSG
jgi:hypothetical protein